MSGSFFAIFRHKDCYVSMVAIPKKIDSKKYSFATEILFVSMAAKKDHNWLDMNFLPLSQARLKHGKAINRVD